MNAARTIFKQFDRLYNIYTGQSFLRKLISLVYCKHIAVIAFYKILSITQPYLTNLILGTKVIAATSNFVRVYNAVNGEFIAPLKGHKDAVYCVCYNRDGSRFASGKLNCVML